MKQETINQFHDYLKDQGHENTTIAGYIRTICDLRNHFHRKMFHYNKYSKK